MSNITPEKREHIWKAFLENNKDELTRLFKEDSRILNSYVWKGSTLLYWAARREEKLDMLKFLLDSGADINKGNKEGDWPLRAAVSEDNEDAVKELLKRGARIDEEYADEDATSLAIAVDVGFVGVVKALLDAGAKIDLPYATPLIHLALNIANLKGETEVVKLLVAKGADVNQPNKVGSTVFFVATFRKENPDLMKFLVERGADVNKGDSKGNTPIYNSAKRGHLETVKIILNAPGFDSGQKYKLGAGNATGTILDLAMAGKLNEDAAEIIIDKLGAVTTDEPWEGFVKSDVEMINGLFGKIQFHEEHPENEQRGFVPLDDISYCPICLGYNERRAERSGNAKGCLYITHDCRRQAKGNYNRALYLKYRNDTGLITWCTTCNRLCVGHKHYKVAANAADPDAALPEVEEYEAGATAYDKSCEKHGGGGINEKVARLLKYLDKAKELNGQVGRISKQDAIKQLSEALVKFERGNANRSRVRNVQTRKRFNTNNNAGIRNKPYISNKVVAKVYPDPVRPKRDELKPLIDNDTSHKKYNSAELEDLDTPAILFRHVTETGKEVKHAEGDGPTGDGGEWLSIATIRSIVKGYVKDAGGDEFGLCPHRCGALLYPEELEVFLRDGDDKKLLDDYRKLFNKWFAETRGMGGGKRGGRGGHVGRRTRRKPQRGGAKEALFHRLTDVTCALPDRKRR